MQTSAAGVIYEIFGFIIENVYHKFKIKKFKEQNSSAPYRVLKLLVLLGILFSGYSFTALVSDRTACFASRLTGASAFSAARNLFFAGSRYRLNHNY